MGHSRTSSTSSTGKQKRSRPLRKTQYCDSAGRSSSGPIASSISAVSASGGSGASWNSSFIKKSGKSADSPQKLLTCKRFGNVSVGALLLAPIFIAGGIFRSHQNYRYGLKLRAAFQFAADLEAVAFRHYYVQQN